MSWLPPWVVIWILIILCAALVLEGYLLLGQGRRLLRWAHQLLGSADDLLAEVPGRSAPPTEAPDDVRPREFYEQLRAETDVVDAELVEDLADDEDPGEQRTDTTPAGQVVETWAHAEDSWGRDETTVMPAPDAADRALSGFRDKEGRSLR